jgi:hypothetical protein
MSSPKNKKKGISFFELFRLFFLIFLSAFLVYLYYLHTKGALLSDISKLWKQHQKIILAVCGFIAYSGCIFYLGVRKGRKG